MVIVVVGMVLEFICGVDGVFVVFGILIVVFIFGGMNDGDVVYIYGVWIEYVKKLLSV